MSYRAAVAVCGEECAMGVVFGFLALVLGVCLVLALAAHMRE